MTNRMQQKKVLVLHLGLDHYAHHVVPIAAELSFRNNVEVVLGGYPFNRPLVDDILKDYPNHNVKWWELDITRIQKILDINKKGLPRVKHIFLRYKNRFKSFDLVVSPTLSFERIRELVEAPDLNLAYCTHGAGDYVHGFLEAMNKYDLHLVSGQKIVDRMKSLGRKARKEVQIIGYPKFDLLRKRPNPSIFNNGNPTYLFNSHFREELDSYSAWGTKILDYFLERPHLNLIFAPHILFFEKVMKPRKFPKKYLKAPNIHVDFGSEACVDMTYVLAADVYIGDGSSQVYEFLVEKKPCVFLNPHGHDWKGNDDFAHWRFGEVVEKESRVIPAIEEAKALHPNYIDVQNEWFDYTFDLNDEPSGKRAADAIINFLTQHQ